MFFKNNGNLGVGNNNPQSKLQIENAGEQLRLTYPSVASYIHEVKSDGDYAIDKDGTERLRIDSSGRLLLGTATEGETPADDLTIATSGSTGITIRSVTSSQGNIFFSDGTSRYSYVADFYNTKTYRGNPFSVHAVFKISSFISSQIWD